MNRARRPKSRPPIWSPEGVEPLVGQTMSAHLERVMPESGRGPLPRGGRPYPDRPVLASGADGWVADAFEGVISARGLSNPGDQPRLAAAAVIEACRRPLENSLVHLAAERLGAVDGPDQVDALLDAIREAQPINRERLAELARWICACGVTMNQLKSAIALLGIAGSPRDADLVIRLGLLDVLTLYSVVALRHLLPDPYPAVFDLAQQAYGWGRIHALRRLIGATDPAIRSWVLRGGYDSGVIVEETAYIGATTGGLATALQGEIDDELLDHAGILLAALAEGGPAEDMSHYASGELAMDLYLGELATAAVSVGRLRSLMTLSKYLHGWADTNARLSVESRARLATRASEVVGRPEWKALIERVFASDDLGDVRRVTPVASAFGLDPKPVLLRWMEREPHDPFTWFWLAHSADRAEILHLCELAERLLPASELPTGATKLLGLEPEFVVSRCFEYLLQELVRFPLVGWRELRIGLGSRFYSSRSVSLRALAEWPRESWPDDAGAILVECVAGEPDEKLKQRFVELLAGAPS